ncbi:MAG TPA: penicillin-binding protein 2, partial [Oceanithermus profundus]|nr:penicillin-binding protein 2 [Oceanithermus profundus]
MNAASVQRVWVLTVLLAAWLALLAMGLASILRTTPLPSASWPEPARPQPVVPPRGAIYAADGTPLALSLQNGERTYPMGALAGQVVGYVKGKRDPESGHINTAGEPEAGQAGVERAMEGRLGRAGDVYLT